MEAVTSDPYDAIAAYYDLGMAGFDDDVALYLGLAQRSTGRILELGCGAGRLVDALASHGYQVVGIDRSSSMLARARARLESHGESARLVRASICRPPLCCRFDLAVLAIDTFLHLGTLQEQLACLRAVRGLLSEGGVLVIDLPSPAAPGWEDWSPGVRPLVPAWSADLEDGTRVDKLSAFDVDASAQTHHVTELYDRTSPDGILRRTAVQYTLRFVFPAELELLLASAGLKLVDRYGDYDLGPFTATSARQICITASDSSVSTAVAQC